MELVYLWVEKYKNIKNQGFNFSRRFMCKYKKGSGKSSILAYVLTICSSKKFLKINLILRATCRFLQTTNNLS